MKNRFFLSGAAALAGLAFMVSCSGNNTGPFYYNCSSPSDIDAFMSVDSGRTLISGHRGGNMPGYPENCIETFSKILESMPVFYEIDPRMTKDSVIVLMHDSDIGRTTTGHGKVSDYTYAELQEFNLVDRWGDETPYKIPSVEDVVKWSQGKVILNFDIKDVTRDVLVPFVNSLGAENCIYTVRNAQEALEVYNLDRQARMSAWVKDMAQLDSYKAAGIPMENIALAYVCAPEMRTGDEVLYEALRNEGIPCMVSTAPKQDKAGTPEERRPLYEAVLASGPDIVETDFPLEFLDIAR